MEIAKASPSGQGAEKGSGTHACDVTFGMTCKLVRYIAVVGQHARSFEKHTFT